MKNSRLKTTIYLSVILLFANCSGNDDNEIDNNTSCFNGTWIQEVSSELTDWTSAIQLYGQDPSEENCNNYTNTLIAYIDALDRIKECVPTVSLAEFNEAIEETRQELSNFDCSEN